MGTCVIGGMLAASFLAIFLIPALFYVVEKLSGEKQHEKAAALSLEPTAPAVTAVHKA
jgi:HAE1 family hydrophobic/amphiphilic exporter-1